VSLPRPENRIKDQSLSAEEKRSYPGSQVLFRVDEDDDRTDKVLDDLYRLDPAGIGSLQIACGGRHRDIEGKHVKITGRIEMNKGKPEIRSMPSSARRGC
jgi:hypothetical protein